MTIETLILATQNPGKVKELANLLADLNINVVSAADAEITDDIDEDAETLAGNAIKKAAHIAKKSNHWAVADDTGLFVDALRGTPGVYSSRWAGPNFPREQLGDYLLEKLAGVPANKRTAHWECAIALAAPTGKYWIFTGTLAGVIAGQKRGQPRPQLPYDSVFQPDGETRVLAELSLEEKNSISHRGRAIAKLKQFIIEQTS